MIKCDKGVKILALLSIVLVICCCGCGKANNNNQVEAANKVTSQELIEQIFDIGESKYKIVEEKNKLNDKEYGGSYSVVIKLEQEDVPTFIAQVNENYYIPDDIEGYSILINNIYGKELDESDTFYTRTSGVRRTIEGTGEIPKTCGLYIICSENTNGEYEVKMVYSE